MFVKALSPGNLMALRLWLRGMPPYAGHALRKYVDEALLDPDSPADRAVLEAAVAQRDNAEIEHQQSGDMLGPGHDPDEPPEPPESSDLPRQ
ncbi:MAG TPA: hypothetical protein VGN52_00280 [Burkholderiales bacterium]|jgi:hypothetical protein